MMFPFAADKPYLPIDASNLSKISVALFVGLTNKKMWSIGHRLVCILTERGFKYCQYGSKMMSPVDIVYMAVQFCLEVNDLESANQILDSKLLFI